MNILVIGGTYFLGKAFVDEACEKNNLVLINRGSRQVDFPYPAHIKQITCDRQLIQNVDFSQYEFDVVVDFCAYREGDIENLVKALNGKVSQYIFVSTSDVFKRGTGNIISEDGEFETRDLGGQAGAYILGKVALEKELAEVKNKYSVSANAVRPAFIYGPGNYANRESMFFQWIEKANQILYPQDATGSFQMVYVKDVAKALLLLCNNKQFENKNINLVGDEIITYDSFASALEYATNKSFEKVELSVADINERQIPLPFPLTKEESETYKSECVSGLGMKFCSLREGLKETYRLRLEQSVLSNVDKLFQDNDPKGAEEFMLNMRNEAKQTQNASLEITVLNELIGYYRQTSEKDKLLATIEDSFRILDEIGENDTLRYATVTLNAANAYRSIGELAKAKDYYSITESIYSSFVKEGRMLSDDLRIAGLYNNLSLLCQEYGNYQEAEKHLLNALTIVSGKKAKFKIAVTYANLANTCVLAKAYDRAREYANTSIRLFKARGYIDAHCSAALSALGTCYFEEGNVKRAEAIFTEALKIVENTIGKNSQYNRILDNINKCRELEKESYSGMELAKKYYEEYGKQMIAEKFSNYSDKIAVGLCGEGSDCYGYDDELSTDHDFGADFCMWVSDETYNEIGKELEEAYNELPDEFLGYKRTVTSTGQGRRGVMKISDFYKKFIGKNNYNILCKKLGLDCSDKELQDVSFNESYIGDTPENSKDIDYSVINDYALSACTNGEVFVDCEGQFSAIRAELLKGYSGRVRFLKIAEEAASFSQCAQYNYIRMLNRNDEFTAQMMLNDGIRHAIKLYHFIFNKYIPHDKWLFRSVKEIPGSEEFVTHMEKAMSQFVCESDKMKAASSLEELGTYLARLMYDRSIISDVNPYLDFHTEELIIKSQVADLNEDELSEKIARLEFSAFDKVKNEGGRAYCQNDWPTFWVMRKSQYLTWDKEMLVQYFYDFTRELNLGHNLITEKYGRMMESTDEARWNEIKDNFPEISEEKKAVIEQIVSIQMEMMEAFAEVHQKTAANARTLHTYEDRITDTSYETYLRGEISTYSDKMLQLYGRFVVMNYQNGENIAYKTMENTAKLYGFKSLEEFEKH